MTDRKLGKLTVKSVDDDQDPHINALIYGDSGVGKTTLVGSAAAVEEMSPVLHLDIEDGRESLKNLYDVDYTEIRTIKELEQAYNELAKGGHGYKTVTIDNISELQSIGLVEMLKEAEGEYNTLFYDADVPEWKQYNKSTEQIRRIMQYFRRLPIHTLFAAWRIIDEEKDSKGNVRKRIIRPSLTSKASKMAPGFVNDVWYMYDARTGQGGRETVRKLQTQKDIEVIAKHRSRKLPNPVINPTMLEIYKTLKEG